MKIDMLPAVIDSAENWDDIPALVAQGGNNARFAWDELFSAEIRNPHTRRAYLHAVRQFLDWCHAPDLDLRQITPRWVGTYYDQMTASIPTKKQHLAALRKFFDQLVVRHAVMLNPAASVRGERYQMLEGKTPEIGVEEARKLLTSIRLDDAAGVRDRAIVATLIYTAARIGAVAALKIGSFAPEGTQWSLRFHEKGGRMRNVPARDDLVRYLTDYLDAAGLRSANADEPMFRAVGGSAGMLKAQAMTAGGIRRMIKRRMSELSFSTRLSPHSFRVTTLTNLLEQGIPLEEVQHFAGHADPRTTRLYDRRQRAITRRIVDTISI